MTCISLAKAKFPTAGPVGFQSLGSALVRFLVGTENGAGTLEQYLVAKLGLLLHIITTFFPQQRKLMGSSAQISSGVCRCGSQEQVPEKGSGRFRKVPVCCWYRLRRQVPEGSGEFRCVLV